MFWICLRPSGPQPDSKKKQLFLSTLKTKMGRVARLATGQCWDSAEPRQTGLLVCELSASELFVAQEANYFGQRRMRDDPQAPSRSYLKLEEALGAFGTAINSGETVVDLGAAPGGWSYAAAKRGAFVWAIDNGPLKKAAASSDCIQHYKADAFSWTPPRQCDWLLCDMVERPERVMKRIGWYFSEGYCANAIVNLKYGFLPIADLLRLIDSYRSSEIHIDCRHLFHDRDELTLFIRQAKK